MAFLYSILSFSFVFDSCKDTPDQIARYRRKISGPLLDRIDLHLEIPPVTIEALQAPVRPDVETSAQVRARVSRLHQLQRQRQGCLNSELGAAQIQEFIPLQEDSRQLLKQAVERLGISARSYHRILRVARTLADMAGQTQVGTAHLAEALNYRSFERTNR
jgi:magnesium chelatase family protein